MRLARLAFLAVGVSMTAAVAHAQVIVTPPPAAAGPCASIGTLQDLINLGPGGCTVGDKQFYNWASHIVPGPGTFPATFADVHYDVFSPDQYKHGFIFTSSWDAPAGTVFDQSIRYSVWDLSGAYINDVHLSQAGEFARPGPGGAAPTGFVSIDEDICLGGYFFVGCPLVTSISTHYNDGGPDVHNAQANFARVRLVDIVKDIHVNGGNGGAGFSIMDQYVTQTPEPATIGLMGLGLGLCGIVARRRLPRRLAR